MKGFIKLSLIYVLRLLVRLFYIFPIKKNRLFFSSYRGTQYSCSPKFIFEKINEVCPDKYQIVWAFQDPKKFAHLLPSYVKVVKYYSLKRFFFEATAKVSINNIGSFSWIPLRRKQEHINTWHSGLDLESCGLKEPRNNSYKRKTIYLSGKETTLFLSPNAVFTEYGVIEQFGYHGLILNAGLPRSDCLINEKSENLRKETRKTLNIPDDVVAVMYAPTWRYGGTEAMPEMNYEMMSNALTKRFGDKFVILNRSHHLTRIDLSSSGNYVLDVSDFPDIEALILACDVLISDYSSVLWDGALSNKVLLQYAPDFATFEVERGLYVPVGNWGMPAAVSMEDLCTLLSNVDLKKDTKYADTLKFNAGNYETGKAAVVVEAWINDRCFGEDHSVIYKDYLAKCSEKSDDTRIGKMKAMKSLK